MKYLLLLLATLVATPAAAEEIRSVYTKFDLDHCKVVAPADDTIFEGTWSCKGYGGFRIVISGEDARNYASFEKGGGEHCAARQGFGAFNTALSPIEWRLAKGKPFAAIERWSMTDGEGKHFTWLVVTSLKDDDSCHAAYIAGNVPGANAEARKAADSVAQNFDCADGKPAVIAKDAQPPLTTGQTCRQIEGLSYE
ncbi:hypothetical protein BH10PSE7_BH10PSE7_33750 [soil metagenome]